MVSNTTVDTVGAQSAPLKTTEHEKVMLTVCLAPQADGTKLKLFTVFRATKRETKALDEEFRSKCVVQTSANAWMNEELTHVWVQSPWLLFIQQTPIRLGFLRVPYGEKRKGSTSKNQS